MAPNQSMLFTVGSIFIISVVNSSYQDNSCTVTCEAGTFLGSVKTFNAFGNDYAVSQFLGIPYAEPPTNERRFRKPVRKAAMTKPFDATEYGASCLALDMLFEGKRKPGQHYIQSEDCLFLNIFTPNRVDSEKSLPVLLFIYGGGFNLGTSTTYPGHIISAYGEVVFVTINYRLNIWGFLSTGDKASPGNYGLWDQQMAIQWVHDNIKAFGGDPNRVTISGNSAGSASVVYQAMFPGNKGLIKGFIPQSGSPRCPWAFNKDPINAARKVGRLLGCNMQGSFELVQCIKTKPAEDIVKVINERKNFIIFPMEFVTVVDGEFVKHSPHELLNENSLVGSEERKLLSSYDLLTGVTANEGLMMISDFVLIRDAEDFTINKEQFLNDEIPKIAKIMFSEDSTKVIEELIQAEYFPWDNPDNDTQVREAFLRLSSDYVFNIQGVQTAHVHSAHAHKKTFFYVLDAIASQHIMVTPTWADRANHCDELTYLLGFDNDSGFTAWTMPYTEEDPEDWEIELSKTMMTMWANFARSGNPNIPKDTKVTWPTYTPEKREALRISRETSAVLLNPYAKAYNFWYNTLPSVLKATKNQDVLRFCPRPEI